MVLDNDNDSCVQSNRVGKFLIPRKFFYELSDAELAYIFQGMIVVSAVSIFHLGCVEYMAYSPVFSPQASGSEAPTYKLIILIGEGKMSITVSTDFWDGPLSEVRHEKGGQW